MISQPADAVPRSIARKPRGKIGFHSKIRTKGGDFMPSKKVAKKFLAKWGSDYQHPGEKIVTIRFFTQDKGYDEYDIEEIKALRIGGVYKASDGSSHTVKRLS